MTAACDSALSRVLAAQAAQKTALDAIRELRAAGHATTSPAVRGYVAAYDSACNAEFDASEELDATAGALGGVAALVDLAA